MVLWRKKSSASAIRFFLIKKDCVSIGQNFFLERISWLIMDSHSRFNRVRGAKSVLFVESSTDSIVHFVERQLMFSNLAVLKTNATDKTCLFCLVTSSTHGRKKTLLFLYFHA